jgi:hypothetical protein
VLRLGCLGCLTLLVLLALVGAASWGVLQVTQAPDFVGAPSTPADGIRAQQKIFEVLRRAGRGRPHTVVFSEQEVNAFLSRHLGETTEMTFRNSAVRLLGDGRADIAGQIPVRSLLNVAPLSALARTLPAAWLDHAVWVALRARVTLEDSGAAGGRRQIRLDVERFWLGRQRLPELMLRVLLDPAALRLLRWPVPDAIGGLRVEPGRLVVQSAS